MSISPTDLRLPKQALPIFENYANIYEGQTDVLREKIERTFNVLHVLKHTISREKKELPAAKQKLLDTQKTWLGWMVVQLKQNNCLLNGIARILSRLLPAFRREIEKQNTLENSIQRVQELKASKHLQLNALKNLEKELIKPTAFSNHEFLHTLLEHSVYPIASLENYRGDIEDLSIQDIHAPITSGIAWTEEGGREFFIIIIKTPSQAFRGLMCYQRYLSPCIASDHPEKITWKTKELLELNLKAPSAKYLVKDGFVQETFYKFLTTLLQRGHASWSFEQDGERWFTPYLLATAEEVENLLTKSSKEM